jgi:hypothetical protein
MLLSSPHSRSFRTKVPAAVFVVATAVVAWVQKGEIVMSPLSTVFLLAFVYACAAWVLFRPFRLRVADSVEEQGDMLSIRRDGVIAFVPYQGVQDIEVLRIGTSFGAKLTFSNPSELGSEIGFFLNDPAAGSLGIDPVEHIKSRLGDGRAMPSNTSFERTREG